MRLAKNDRAYWLALHEVDGLGPQRFPLLIKYFGSAKAAWDASSKKLLKIGLNTDIVKKIKVHRSRVDPETHLKTLLRMGVKIVTSADKEYPEPLRQIKGSPNVLYVKGSLKLEDAKSIAVVGTRKPTLYGREITEKLTHQIVRHGFTVVSGLARGVDSVAHRSALDAGGRTIAVMATGIDQVYPPENRELASKIVQGGALVSEFRPGYIAVPGNFPARNRIISGLSLGVLVTEGAAKSGTKITAKHALNQGREVFAVPGPITSQMSEAPSDLMKLGAKVVTGIQDILDELDIEKTMKRSDPAALQGPTLIEFENKLEEKLYQLLSNGQVHVDELVRSSKKNSAEVSSTLTMMEVKGLVKHLGGMVYSRN